MQATLDGPAAPASPGHRVGNAWWWKVIRFVVAVAASAAVTLVAVDLLPSLLPSRTDIVGRPIWLPFDGRRYEAIYVLWMVLFPGLATIVYLALGRGAGSAASLAVEPAQPTCLAPTAPPPRWFGHLAALSALFFVVLPGAFALALVARAGGSSFGRALVATTLAALFVLLLVAAVAARGRAIEFEDATWAVAALVAPTGFLALSVISSRTGVLVTDTGGFDRLDWFPFWLGLPLSGLALGAVWWFRLHRPRRDWRSLGLSALIWCTVPALLWVFVGSIPPALGAIDAFHEGEALVGSKLLLDGQLPWRDFLAVHGLLTDSLISLPGLAFIGESRWGAESGRLVWVVPLFWTCWFAFMVYLFRRNRWLLLLWSALVIVGPAAAKDPNLWPILLNFQTYERSILYPLVLLAMAWTVRKPAPGRIALLSGLMVALVVLTPETIYVVPGVFVALAAFDWQRPRDQRRSRWLWATTQAALWCFLWSAAVATLLAIVGALDGFVEHFQVFAFGHDLTGAHPFAWGGPTFSFAAVGPPLLFLVVIWYGIARLITRRPFELDDFVIMPAFVFAGLYYTKFLARADLDHALQSWTIALPVLWYVVARLLGAADRASWRRFPRTRVVSHGASILVVGVVLVLLVPTASSRTTDTPTRFRPRVPIEPLAERLGYSTQNLDNVFGVPDTVFVQKAQDVRTLVDAMDPGTRQVFDFTNSPAFFHFALPYSPPSRYYHISMAMPLAAQEAVIRDLQRSRPKVVVDFSSEMGLNRWDLIPNMVRHYAVSRYLQTHYRPVVQLDGFVFMLRDDVRFDESVVQSLALTGAPGFANLEQVPHPCDWRAAPERFTPEPADDAKRSGPLATTPIEGTLRIGGWAVDLATGEPAAEVVALGRDGVVLAATTPTGDRPDISANPALTRARASGFSLDVPVAPGESVVVAARRADGTLLRIGGPIDRVVSPPLGPMLVVGRGAIETADLIPVFPGTQAFRVALPGGPRDWNWLTLRATEATLEAGVYTVGVPAGAGSTQLRLTKGGQQETNLMVGACNQWYDYQAEVRVISTPAGLPAPRIEFTR